MVDMDLKKENICNAFCYAIVAIILHALIFAEDAEDSVRCTMEKPVTHFEWFEGWLAGYYAGLVLCIIVILLLSSGKKDLAEKVNDLRFILFLFFFCWSIVGLVSFFDPRVGKAEADEFKCWGRRDAPDERHEVLVIIWVIFSFITAIFVGCNIFFIIGIVVMLLKSPTKVLSNPKAMKVPGVKQLAKMFT